MQPTVAVVADSATTDALVQSRARLVAGTSEQSFPILRDGRAGRASRRPGAGSCSPTRAAAIPAVLSGTLDDPVLTGPTKIDGLRRHAGCSSLVDEARRTAALARGRCRAAAAPIERVVTEQAAGNLQMRPARHRAQAAPGHHLHDHHAARHPAAVEHWSRRNRTR